MIVNRDCDLGASLLLFPGQRIWVHTSGYEDDSLNFEDDDTGEIVDNLHEQVQASYYRVSDCTEEHDADGALTSGCAAYSLNYSIIGGQLADPPNLTQGAQLLYNAYIFFAPAPIQLPCPVCDVIGDVWYPFNLILPAGSPPIALQDTLLYAPQDPEEHALTGIGLVELRQQLRSTYSTDPAKVERFLTELRSGLDKALSSGRPSDDIALALIGYFQISAAVPVNVWNRHFGNLPFFEQLCDRSAAARLGLCRVLEDDDLRRRIRRPE